MAWAAAFFLRSKPARARLLQQKSIDTLMREIPWHQALVEGSHLTEGQQAVIRRITNTNGRPESWLAELRWHDERTDRNTRTRTVELSELLKQQLTSFDHDHEHLPPLQEAVAEGGNYT